MPNLSDRRACCSASPSRQRLSPIAVLAEERLELGPGWLVDGVLGGRRWVEGMSEAFQDRRPQAS